jgi:peptidylprolyl isomerase
MKILFIPLFALVSIAASCNSSAADSDESANDSISNSEAQIISESGLIVEILEKGNGPTPSQGDLVKVHYTGTLKSTGEKFDSSVDRGEPIEFPIGVGRVIQGWEEGISQLNRGSKARLIIPANMAYGAKGKGTIPPNSDLIFEVELIDFKEGPKPIVHEVFSTEGKTVNKTATGLEYCVIDEGKGPKPIAGDVVTVHYYGYLKASGDKFDSSFERGEPFKVSLGAR